MKKIIFGYFFIALLFSIFSYAFVDQNLFYYHQLYTGVAFQERGVITSIYIFFVVILFIFYFFSLRFFVHKNDKKQFIVLIGGLWLIFLFAYPAMLSYDIFNYVTTAKVLFFYHENPYIIMPIAFLGDPYLAFIHAANKIALYAPLWIILTGIPHYIGVGNFFATIVSFKLTTTIFYFLMLVILWKLANKNVFPVVLFALNPLVLIETLMSGHNDIVMIFFALFSLFLLQQKRYAIAFICLIVSVLIKYATIFLLPVFLVIFVQSIRKKKIDWEKMFFVSALSMFIIFLLSPIREEMYPWYAIWFLPFVFLIPERKALVSFTIAFSFGLMLRYIPYMYLGTYFGMTPIIRILVTIMPVVFIGIYLLSKKIRIVIPTDR